MGVYRTYGTCIAVRIQVCAHAQYVRYMYICTYAYGLPMTKQLHEYLTSPLQDDVRGHSILINSKSRPQ